MSGTTTGFVPELILKEKVVGVGPKAISARQIDEVTFWSQQFKEHALFLFLGLQPSPKIETKTEDKSVAKNGDKSVENDPAVHAKLITKLKYRCKQLMGSWLAFEKMVKEGKIDLRILSNLVNHTRYIKSRIMDLQSKNVWVGPLFPEFVEHLRDELDYFVARFNNQLSPDEEKVFWVENNAEHLAFVAHLLNTDNRSRPLVQQALDLSDEGMALISSNSPDLLQMAELSRRFDHLSYAHRTDAFTKSLPPTIYGSIHPVMINHIIKEGARSIARLMAIGAPPPNAAGQALAYQRLALAIRK